MHDPVAQRHTLVCLLFIRSGDADLDRCLESASCFADAVLALDDGAHVTEALSRRHPILKTVLAPAPSAAAGPATCSAELERLLDAAAGLDPTWIVCLDSRERIPREDAEALRRFLRDAAVRGAAYGLTVEPPPGERRPPCAFRLFAFRRGQRFSRRVSPAAIVPLDIPRAHWIETTLRIRTGSDPEEPRARDLAVVPEDRTTPLAHAEIRGIYGQPLDPDRPALSAIVISQNDRARIEEVMDALVAQEVDRPVELILVNSGRDGTAEFVRERYPRVRVVHLPEPALPGKARNAGLKIATGDFVTFPGSHIVLPPGALQKRLDAHENGYAMVCGCVLNGTDTRAGWASYFLDHCVSLPGRPSNVLRLPPSRCSYLRSALTAIGGFPEDRRVGEDTVVNTRLFDLGYRSYYSSNVQSTHKSPCTSVSRLLRHHYERGLGFGRILWEQAGRPRHLAGRAKTLRWVVGTYPLRRVRFIRETVRDWGATVRRQFVLSFPLVLAGVASAALGAVVFLIRPRTAAGSAPVPIGTDRVSAR